MFVFYCPCLHSVVDLNTVKFVLFSLKSVQMLHTTKTNVIVCFTLIVSICGGYTDKALSDQIISLPRSTPLLSNQFSGFLDITDSKNLHYMYFESERSPETDSVVFWTNGGPGCSGLLGLFTGRIQQSLCKLFLTCIIS